jgi:hypothetical protein
MEVEEFLKERDRVLSGACHIRGAGGASKGYEQVGVCVWS